MPQIKIHYGWDESAWTESTDPVALEYVRLVNAGEDPFPYLQDNGYQAELIEGGSVEPYERITKIPENTKAGEQDGTV